MGLVSRMLRHQLPRLVGHLRGLRDIDQARAVKDHRHRDGGKE
jgi:hypothetical protein